MAKKAPDLIHFHYLTHNFSLRNRTALKQFIYRLITAEGRTIQTLNYVFCTDDYLLQVNQTYLHHNTYTDIITFELSAPTAPLLSDIYISIDRVKENAGKFNAPFTQELHRVIFHGALHLCGYKDKTKSDSQEMRQKENHWLDRYFVSRGTNAL